MICLATNSPYREAVFKNLGYPVFTLGSEIDEKFLGRPTDPEELVLTLAKMKAKDVAEKYNMSVQGVSDISKLEYNENIGCYIGMDSLCYFDGQILEKPKDENEALERLQKLSGNNFTFLTGVYIVNFDTKEIGAGPCESKKVVKTNVWLRELEQEEMENYIENDDGITKIALGYDSFKGRSASFTKRIEGSIFNYISGVPIEVIPDMLKEVDYAESR